MKHQMRTSSVSVFWNKTVFILDIVPKADAVDDLMITATVSSTMDSQSVKRREVNCNHNGAHTDNLIIPFLFVRSKLLFRILMGCLFPL